MAIYKILEVDMTSSWNGRDGESIVGLVFATDSKSTRQRVNVPNSVLLTDKVTEDWYYLGDIIPLNSPNYLPKAITSIYGARIKRLFK